MKTSIVKIFLEELKSRRKRGWSRSGRKGGEGILSKLKLENYLEILRRVKVVFDEGDFEERALALYLFGCWADFAKDSADIRYVILSSTVSDNVLEVMVGDGFLWLDFVSCLSMYFLFFTRMVNHVLACAGFC